MNERRPNPRLFWILAGIGFAVMAYGVFGLLAESDRTHPGKWVRWFVGSAIAHDFVVAPVTIAVAVIVVRYVAPTYRSFVQGAMIATGLLVLTFYPFVRGFGRSSGNASVLPNNYARGLIVALALVWFATGALLLLRWLSRVRSARREPGG
jgi:hypothetical protein